MTKAVQIFKKTHMLPLLSTASDSGDVCISEDGSFSPGMQCLREFIVKQGMSPGPRWLAGLLFLLPMLFSGRFPGLLAVSSLDADAARCTCGKQQSFWQMDGDAGHLPCSCDHLGKPNVVHAATCLECLKKKKKKIR